MKERAAEASSLWSVRMTNSGPSRKYLNEVLHCKVGGEKLPFDRAISALSVAQLPGKGDGNPCTIKPLMKSDFHGY